MDRKPKIVLVGGGSVIWSPKLLNDLMLTPGLENAHYEILDIDQAAGLKILEYGNMLKKIRGASCTLNFSDNQKEAFKGADYVIITISTGGLDSMQYDLSIPQDYRIYHTVGDTVGPGGWARALRNIQVFVEIAKDIENASPDAVVLNYTNPMSILTKVFSKVTKLKTIGLCHGLFEVYNILMDIFALDCEEDIKVSFGGINHFFWILDFKIKGQNGYELLKSKIGNGNMGDLLRDFYKDKNGEVFYRYVTSELYEQFGYLTYIADRHIAEFFPYYLTGNDEKIRKYKLMRTSIEDRWKMRHDAEAKLEANVNGSEPVSNIRSRETAADIIGAFVNDKNFIDVLNLPNSGQISNLPEGSIVETLGVVNSLGFKPISVGALPEPICNIVMPHVLNQNMLVEAGLEGNMDKAMWALCNDPMCANLTFPEIREMGMKLMKAHKQYLPQFNLDR